MEDHMERVTATTTTLAALMADLEDLWQKIDAVLGSLGPADWSRKHGKDWTFADVPYHLAYFDRQVIANGIARGQDVPTHERRVMSTMVELNDWNVRNFAGRPATQTVEQSLAQMRASRDAIRQAVAGLSDADLVRPVWSPLPGGGWQTVRSALEGCTAHTWNHLMELRLRLKRTSPAPTPSQTHRALAFYMNIFPSMCNRAQAANTHFTSVMEFTGPGGGAWSLHVADGTCCAVEERAPRPDLVLTQSYETFQATMIGAQNPVLAMLTGKIKVRGLRNMGTFGKLFPPPKPDTIFGSPGDTALAPQ
jgi:DinB family protein/SCP-2 sterol transfer family protein